jgi:chemotaxis protein CheC
MFKTRFYQKNTDVESLFYLVPTREAFDNLVSKLEAQIENVEVQPVQEETSDNEENGS